MLDRKRLTIAIATGFVVAGLLPTTASRAVAANARHAVFAASEIDVDHPAGALEGTLDVSIFPNGNLMGYYRTADSGHFVQVSGAVLSGGRIYLDIGNERPIVGTFDGTTIVGYRDFGLDRYRFRATRTDQPPT